MAYDAKVIKIMIASPGDVPAARRVLRDAIHEWNSVNAEDRETVLMPIGWESHSAPEMGDRAQGIINRRLLSGCDILVAAFWTRLGTPTGAAASGTVEEIEEHLEAGKPAMIYFSNEPVRMDSVDEDQWRSLKEFRSQIQKRGLVEEFDSPADLREKFTRQLALTIINHFARRGKYEDKGAKSGMRVNSEELSNHPPPLLQDLSETARDLLLEASKDEHGVIVKTRTLGGTFIETNERNLIEEQQPREVTRWEDALSRLLTLALVEDKAGKGQIFSVTHRGYEVADYLVST